MIINGGYSPDQITKQGKAVYDFYSIAQKNGFPVADPIGPKNDFSKTVSHIVINTGVPEKFVQLFFRALYASIQSGENKPTDLHIETGKIISDEKKKNFLDASGLNIVTKAAKTYLIVAGLGAVAFISYNLSTLKKAGSHVKR